MSLTDLIALDLRSRTNGSTSSRAPEPAPAPATAVPPDLRHLIARALNVVRELVAAEELEEDGALLTELEALASQYDNEPSEVPPARAGEACLEQARPLAGRTRKRRAEQRQELSAIVGLVREAVSVAGVQLESIHSEIEATGSSFEAIASLEDPKLVKKHVMAHVTALKQLVAERRKAWEAQRRTLADRITALEQQLTVTKRQASMDALTGVANKGSFDAEFQARLARAGSQLVLAIVDLDGFKGVNDTFGHAEGDRLLAAVAQGLRHGLRESDFVARVGGDEFAVILEGVTLRQAEVRFTNLFAKFRSEISVGGDPPVAPGVSCGLAELSAGDTPASLYERADQALYGAKRAGRNRVAAKTRPLMRDLMRR